MASEREMRQTLLDLIMNEFALEFGAGRSLTGTLRNSIRPEITENGVAITITAPRYSKKILFERGYVQYTGKGSYASQIDERGSWFGYHKDYLDDCIQRAIVKWKAYYKLDANVKELK